MQFPIKVYDGPNMLEERVEARPRQLEGMSRLSEHIIWAGGLLNDGGKMKGSVLIMEFNAAQSRSHILRRNSMSLKRCGRRSRSNP